MKWWVRVYNATRPGAHINYITVRLFNRAKFKSIRWSF